MLLVSYGTTLFWRYYEPLLDNRPYYICCDRKIVRKGDILGKVLGAGSDIARDYIFVFDLIKGNDTDFISMATLNYN